MIKNELKWRLATSSDLENIDRIAKQTHIKLPERIEVFAEKMRLFPQGSYMLVNAETTVGYGISIPFQLYSMPELDKFVHALHKYPDCLLIHDIAILPAGRDRGMGKVYVELMTKLAQLQDIKFLSLVSVYNTYKLWEHLGFKIEATQISTKHLRHYGDNSHYMIRELK